MSLKYKIVLALLLLWLLIFHSGVSRPVLAQGPQSITMLQAHNPKLNDGRAAATEPAILLVTTVGYS